MNKGDITKVDVKALDEIDVFLYSPPCQSFSVAGNRKGLKDPRGQLFYHALPVIQEKKPRYALMENVKGLIQNKFKDLFEDMLRELDLAGYNNYYQVLNAKDCGVPQNRERVFIVSIRKDIDNGSFEFPEPFDSGVRLKDLLEDNVDDKYYVQNRSVEKLIEQLEGERLEEKTICAQRGRYNENGKSEQQIEVQHSGLSNALTTVQKDNLLIEPNKLNFVGGVSNKDWVGDGKKLSRNYPQGNRVYDSNGIACSQTAQGGGIGSFTGLYLQEATPNEINMFEVEQYVRLRRHKVDIEALVECLRSHKKSSKLTNKQLSDQLGRPITMVEHWFRRDSSFSIPDEYIWHDLKDVLAIKTDVFDKPVMEFDEQEGVFEKGNRYYHEDGISPTLTTSANERVIESLQSNYKVRKLTPLECWRLMSFNDEDFNNARQALMDTYYNGNDRANSQLYKQAGNSVVVKVLEEIYKNLF